METLRDRLPDVLSADSDADAPCGCTTSFDGDALVVEAADCDGGGRLHADADCRETVVRALTARDVEVVRVRQRGVERVYEADAASLLVAAGRFAESVRRRDRRLAERAMRDPLGAAREATGRADATSDVAAETGLAELAVRVEDYETGLAPLVGLTVSDWRVEAAPPATAELTAVRDLDTGGTARIYDTGSGGRYHLTPLDSDLDAAAAGTLATAYRRLAEGAVEGGERAPPRAVRQVVAERDPEATAAGTESPPVERLGRVLHRHTRGHGLLAELFADPDVSDVFVTAPADRNPLRVRAGDRTLPTNVRLTERGVEAFAARYRRESGRGFSRADPTLDAATTVGDRQVRVAGVTDPVSEGAAFAFRAHDRDVWTLPALVGNGTLTPAAAGLLSLAVERGAAVLVAGPRGAGKTTLLTALLPELPPDVRTVVIEDAPELPVGRLQDSGRDVQALRTTEESGVLSPTEAVRTALRLGDGALVVGEVRGTEAQSLYEAMRVGANNEAVLGTIHGEDADAVYDRVVDDLGVPPSSFAVTDVVVSLEQCADGTRRVRAIEEVIDGESGSFVPLFQRTDETLASTDRLARGNAQLLETLRRPGETYADLLSRLEHREEELAEQARAGRTDLESVTAAVTERTA
ncbi:MULTISPECIES: type II/IV secretion system ATPase subunit [Salinibaculum]|uniref:type II/IV secretion system ATPase subunit n=1 Tax=Salinibaculum TaxID=2732368 RepID=UPI0030CC3E67